MGHMANHLNFLNPYLLPEKINSKYTEDLNVKRKTYKSTGKIVRRLKEL